MEKIILQPNVWTRFYGRLFQVAGQEAIRITHGVSTSDEDGNSVPTPPTDDAPYFTTQGYDPKVINLEKFGMPSPTIVYLMPDNDSSVGIVGL